MNNKLNRIGIAPFFHSDLPIEKRLCEETILTVLEETARWENDICIFRLPEHLRNRWWNLAILELSKANSHSNFASFLKAFKAFASFKGIPISSEHQFEILIRAPGESFKDNLKLVCVNGLVNLGDEQTVVDIEKQQVLLQPGDGCWVPKGYTLKLADTLTKIDIDILLQIGY